MRHAVAAAISAFLIAGMLLLCYVMPAKMALWEASGHMPSFSGRLLAAAAQIVQAYWFLLFPLAIAAGLVAGAAFGRKEERD